jgi:hypothetical protein
MATPRPSAGIAGSAPTLGAAMTVFPNPTSTKSSRLLNTAFCEKVRDAGLAVSDRETKGAAWHCGGRISLSKVLMRASDNFSYEGRQNHFLVLWILVV